MNQGHILVVDDQPDVQATIAGLLEDEGYEVKTAASKDEALQLIKAYHFHVAVLDVRLDEQDENNEDGLKLMHQISDEYPTIVVIMLTGYGTLAMAQQALRQGIAGVAPAFDFLRKDEDFIQLSNVVERAFKTNKSF